MAVVFRRKKDKKKRIGEGRRKGEKKRKKKMEVNGEGRKRNKVMERRKRITWSRKRTKK